jgi:uncharacterized membrane protein YkoI
MEEATMKKNSSLRWLGSIAIALLIMGVGGNKMALAASQTPGVQSGAGQHANAQVPTYTCSIKVPEPEPRDLSTLAKIKADQAMAAAQAAFPGVAVKKVELDNENGCLVYSVDMSNGMEVLVDAGNGVVLKKETAEAEEHEGHEKGENED